MLIPRPLGELYNRSHLQPEFVQPLKYFGLGQREPGRHRWVASDDSQRWVTAG